MAAIFDPLAVFVDAYGALGALDDGIAHFREIAEAGRAGSLEVILGALVEFGFPPRHVLPKTCHIFNPGKLPLRKAVVLIAFHSLVVIQEIYGFLSESFLKILDDELLLILFLKMKGITLSELAVPHRIFPP